MRCSDAHRILVSEGRAPYDGRGGGGGGDCNVRDLARHLEACEVCREVSEAYARDVNLIRQAAERIPIDPEFTAMVMRRIRQGKLEE